MFEIYSDGEIKTIMEEYPMGMKKDQWIQAYQYCIEGDHNFLFYDVHILLKRKIKKPKAMRVMKNFDQVVFFK